MEEDTTAIVANVIQQRKTEKVLCEVDEHASPSTQSDAAHKRSVLASLETAGWAPFHFARHPNGIAEPWRAHIVWPRDLKKLALYLRDELGLTSNEPRLVAGCSALILVTWLPEFHDPVVAARSSLSAEKRRTRDEEHLAATAAMVQNLLLMLTAHGMGTYWSSGGKLRGPEAFEYLGISTDERLLAAVFIEYPKSLGAPKQRKPGAHREKRCDAWIREVAVP